ncbi:MAG: hypothetical protein JXQ67_10570 [Campylobacterales bacterium]|nr:hypothetical protein [Campylobacterales bacterium]
MKKNVLSVATVFTLITSSVSAIELYQDANGQVFTSAGQGRTLISGEIKGITPETPSNGITIMRDDSPEFLLGKETHINMKFVPQDNPDMWLKAGVRIQGTFENRATSYADGSPSESISEAYLRRVRFEVAAGFNKWTSFVMDVRNDKANYEDKGEEQFNVGDAYVQIKKPFKTSLVNFKLFRAKIDVSRTETVKSARTIHYDRPQVADEAAQYITHNRRGTNAQVYGDWEKKIHYQLAFGDGVNSGKMKDATGASLADSATQKTFFYGGKVKLSPFDGWEETEVTETYFGQGQHFSLGASYWVSPEISYENGTQNTTIDHTLMNLELSAHYKGLFVQAEYFDFGGVVKDASTVAVETGHSQGWYATSEYVIEELAFIAPYVRYESWNKFEGQDGYDFTSAIAGVNWYLKGNTIKAGLTFQQDKYGSALKDGERTQENIKVTSQFFF